MLRQFLSQRFLSQRFLSRQSLLQRFLLCFFCSVCLLLTGCTDHSESALVYENDIFTPALYGEITEIYFNAASADYHVTEDAFLHDVYQELARLPLEEASVFPPTAGLGFFTFELRTANEEISVLLSDNCLYVSDRACRLDSDTSERIGELFTDWIQSH